MVTLSRTIAKFSFKGWYASTMETLYDIIVGCTIYKYRFGIIPRSMAVWSEGVHYDGLKRTTLRCKTETCTVKSTVSNGGWTEKVTVLDRTIRFHNIDENHRQDSPGWSRARWKYTTGYIDKPQGATKRDVRAILKEYDGSSTGRIEIWYPDLARECCLEGRLLKTKMKVLGSRSIRSSSFANLDGTSAKLSA